MKTSIQSPMGQRPRNKGRLVGQKAPLRLRDIWAIRVGYLLYLRQEDCPSRLLAFVGMLDNGEADLDHRSSQMRLDGQLCGT